MSAPDGFRRVAALAELCERRGMRVMPGEHAFARARVEGPVDAVDSLCPQMHVLTMRIAQLDGTHLSCPMHGWTFAPADRWECEGNGRIKTRRMHREGGEVCGEELRSSR